MIHQRHARMILYRRYKVYFINYYMNSNYFHLSPRKTNFFNVPEGVKLTSETFCTQKCKLSESTSSRCYLRLPSNDQYPLRFSLQCFTLYYISYIHISHPIFSTYFSLLTLRNFAYFAYSNVLCLISFNVLCLMTLYSKLRLTTQFNSKLPKRQILISLNIWKSIIYFAELPN